MNALLKVIFIFFLLITSVKADEATDWLGNEIDSILDAYKNTQISKVERFALIEETINSNFAGAGIAKFVAGKSWGSANKDTKKAYIKIFKKHLALNIASMMQGYSDQDYIFTKSVFDDKNKVNLIDMEIISDTGSLVVTWRLKKSKEKYYVIDLLVADISLIVTKRSEFNSMIKKVDNSLEKFIDVLKKQNELSFNKLIN
tara:strand:- start:1370 stop:1972 length:603 start_codon:yes stop_codon:yes gene_type:complete